MSHSQLQAVEDVILEDIEEAISVGFFDDRLEEDDGHRFHDMGDFDESHDEPAPDLDDDE